MRKPTLAKSLVDTTIPKLTLRFHAIFWRSLLLLGRCLRVNLWPRLEFHAPSSTHLPFTFFKIWWVLLLWSLIWVGLLLGSVNLSCKSVVASATAKPSPLTPQTWWLVGISTEIRLFFLSTKRVDVITQWVLRLIFSFRHLLLVLLQVSLRTVIFKSANAVF
jgi:hypothetical protein